MEKCECLHHGRCLAWPGQNWAEEELYPPPPAGCCQSQESQLSTSSAAGLGLGPTVEAEAA